MSKVACFLKKRLWCSFFVEAHSFLYNFRGLYLNKCVWQFDARSRPWWRSFYSSATYLLYATVSNSQFGYSCHHLSFSCFPFPSWCFSLSLSEPSPSLFPTLFSLFRSCQRSTAEPTRLDQPLFVCCWPVACCTHTHTHKRVTRPPISTNID